jgi:hypothetical protein
VFSSDDRRKLNTLRRTRSITQEHRKYSAVIVAGQRNAMLF